MRNICLTLLVIALLAACTSSRELSRFSKDNSEKACYNRTLEPHTMVVDSHVHFRPFGNNPLDYQKLLSYFERAGVLFVNAYGIGQTLPQQGDCLYPANCPSTPVTPNIANDIINMQNIVSYAE